MLQLCLSVAHATNPPGDWNRANVTNSEGTLLAGDFDGDGFDDLLVRNYNPGDSDVYEGSATGFRASPAYTYDYVNADQDNAVLDLDGDGYDDVVYVVSNELRVLYGSALGLVSDWPHVLPTPTSLYELDSGDLNGDGYGDLMLSIDDTANGGSRVYWWPGSASGLTQAPAKSWSGGQVFGTGDLAVLDANGDGYDDFALGGGSYGAPSLTVTLGGPNGPSAATWDSLPEPPNTDYCEERLLGAGDLNGDGYEDLVCQAYANSAYGFAVFLGGAAGMANAVVTPGVTSSAMTLRRIADTDLDGDDELLVGLPYYDPAGAGNTPGVAAVLKLGANGRFAMPVVGDYTIGSGAQAQAGWSVAAGDFDGTGLPDFVTTSSAAGGNRLDLFYDVP